MKATELRIGNFVNVMGNNRRLTASLFIGRLRMNPPMKDFKPIQLTEDWLLKFGYTTIYTDGTTKEYRIPSSNFGIWVYIYDEYVIYKFTVKDVQIAGVMFVHQLQNIYHALTGEEINDRTLK